MIHAGAHIGGITCIVIFVTSYALVLFEEKIHLSKSKPVMLSAGLIWTIIGFVAPDFGVSHHTLHEAVFHGLGEYASLLLFLLSAMTFISVLEDRNLFAVLREKLVQSGMSFRQIFWATGFVAFFLSPVADNLTTALVMGAVVLAVGGTASRFIALSCINIVSAANAGGAFSPFGDITTLMVWQAGHVDFFEFFTLFLPALVNFLVPALLMSFAVEAGKPDPLTEDIALKKGAFFIAGLFLATIALAVCFEQFLGLPAFLGMMTGLSVLMMTAWGLRFTEGQDDRQFNIFDNIARVEWDTLLFFFGVIFSVSGLAFLGYLEALSQTFYTDLGPHVSNIAIGFVSAILDNIPVMFAVLAMEPQMDHFQWMLITLTAGVGGSLLSIGSAAGVALMGTARGHYTFASHLKWLPALLLGYIASIAVHYIVHGRSMMEIFG